MVSQEHINDLAKQSLFYKDNAHSVIIQKAIITAFADGFNHRHLLTPFTTQDKKPIHIGDFIEDTLENKGAMQVCFGSYNAGKDDWNISYHCFGYYIIFNDGGTYSLTQDGKGYSIPAEDCKVIGNIETNPELIYKPKKD